jgi:ABC-type uncharacterized transport system fused permease/ATPase subunit
MGPQIVDSIVRQEQHVFFTRWIVFIVACLVLTTVGTGMQYTNGNLGILTRKHITDFIHGKYFAKKAYYELICIYKQIDNPYDMSTCYPLILRQ